MIVDGPGLIIAPVDSANVQSRDMSKLLIREMGTRFWRLEVIFAAGVYGGTFVHWAEGWLFRPIRIVKRTSRQLFVVLAKGWIVERTFA